MQLFAETLTAETVFYLVLAVGLTLFFEAINGFHDTANAVATVIYTHSLKPVVAVVWSGIWNLIGVLTSTGAVAFSIVALLPVELVINVGSVSGYAMVFSILLSAIVWNFGTWYAGLPNSSSHTLIGSIMGVGLAHSLLASGHSLSEGINWKVVQEVFFSLLISPLIGFISAALLLLLFKALLTNPELYEPADQKKEPPLWIRAVLILTCTGVSFAHGSNDGQKGMGLFMLILVGIVPGIFALNMDAPAANVAQLAATSHSAIVVLDRHAPKMSLNDQDASEELSTFLKTTGKASDKTFAALVLKNHAIADRLSGKESFREFSDSDRRLLRTDMYLVSSTIGKLSQLDKFPDSQEQQALADYQSMLDKETRFIPYFVKVAIALALGVGTMIGWQRIVVTVGEKIGEDHLSYAQGAAAELVAMSTIAAASGFGLPVSTTHVLSSGVAGTMTANRSGLQMDTLRNILLAWVLTLPASLLISAALFAANFYFIANVLGIKPL